MMSTRAYLRMLFATLLAGVVFGCAAGPRKAARPAPAQMAEPVATSETEENGAGEVDAGDAATRDARLVRGQEDAPAEPPPAPEGAAASAPRTYHPPSRVGVSAAGRLRPARSGGGYAVMGRRLRRADPRFIIVGRLRGWCGAGARCGFRAESGPGGDRRRRTFGRRAAG